ncbi:MAG: hypothetical protein JNJ90_18530 [Saprospiraceae bacterium]|jgi:uncharacterized delta-60 repeat protein|nr:hypothetical protein [Saprospiraceae bacterium]
MKNIVTISTLFLATLSVSFGQSVTFDSTFGVNGIAYISLDKDYPNAYGDDFVLQPDGKILIAGQLEGFGSSGAMQRYFPDGSRDTAFNITQSGYLFDYGLGLQPDGKILFYTDEGLYRFYPSGAADSTFGTNGTVHIKTMNSFGKALQVLPDGKIAVGTGVSAFYAARVNPDGAVDSTFGTNGEVQYDLAPTDVDVVYTLNAYTDGRLLLGGFTSLGGGGWKLSLLRLNPDGSADSTFGVNGWVIHGLKGGSECYGVVILADEKILLTGYTTEDGSQYEGIVARLNPDGSFDQSFGDGGVRYFPEFLEGTGIAVAPDNKIVVIGHTFSFPKDTLFIVRLLENGQNDPDFGNAGVYVCPVTSRYFRTVHLDAQERIVVSGYQPISDSSKTGFLMRFQVRTASVSAPEEHDNIDLTASYYPNPVLDVGHLKFHLPTPGGLSLGLLDVYGGIVHQFFTNRYFEAGAQQIPLHLPVELPAGRYTLQLLYGRTARYVPLIKLP